MGANGGMIRAAGALRALPHECPINRTKHSETRYHSCRKSGKACSSLQGGLNKPRDTRQYSMLRCQKQPQIALCIK